jgi:hypothetical protein
VLATVDYRFGGIDEGEAGITGNEAAMTREAAARQGVLGMRWASPGEIIVALVRGRSVGAMMGREGVRAA